MGLDKLCLMNLGFLDLVHATAFFFFGILFENL